MCLDSSGPRPKQCAHVFSADPEDRCCVGDANREWFGCRHFAGTGHGGRSSGGGDAQNLEVPGPEDKTTSYRRQPRQRRPDLPMSVRF
jgi:hypothetical protein